jgi:DhnA family fructose-bisphosphate aldolase class Ia
MYLVAAACATTLESAFDLRPIQRIEAEDSKLIGEGVQKDQIRTNGVVRLTQPFNNTVEFTFAVGVADRYSITIRYMNKSDEDIPLLIQIEDANGILMRNDHLTFKPTPEDKFKSLGTTTGTQINAGTYKLRLSSAGTAGIVLDYVEVQ